MTKTITEQPAETAETSAEQPTINKSPTKPLRPLTRKQQIFVKHILDNPKSSATQAAAVAYNARSRHTAETIAHENMRKPEIMAELAKHSPTAQYTLVEVMNISKEYSKKGNTAGASYASTAISAANSILDRLHGKATQRIEAQSTSVILNVDLSGEN